MPAVRVVAPPHKWKYPLAAATPYLYAPAVTHAVFKFVTGKTYSLTDAALPLLFISSACAHTLNRHSRDCEFDTIDVLDRIVVVLTIAAAVYDVRRHATLVSVALAATTALVSGAIYVTVMVMFRHFCNASAKRQIHAGVHVVSAILFTYLSIIQVR